MGILKRNSSFLVGLVVILAAGAVIFGSVVAVRVMAQETAPAPAPAPAAPKSNNQVSSFGIDSMTAPGSGFAASGSAGYKPLTVTPTAETPSFIKNRLAEQRGIVLLVYCAGASEDMEMLSHFNTVKAQYAADSSFFSFEALNTTELGDTLDQLRISNPPVLAIIRGDGEVAEMYTGWVGLKVMEQRVADAVRGL